MKKNVKQLLTVLMLILSISSYSQNDFTVTVPSTDNKHNLIIPLKAGSSHQLQVNVKNNRSDICIVSIDEFYFGEPASWISIDNNSRTIYPSQTISFLLTINIPTDAQDRDYYMGLYFDAKKASTNTSIGSFSYNTQTIIVDKSAPTEPGISASSTSKTVTINNFNSWDDRSSNYTTWNPESGINGIKSYTVYLKTLGGSIVATKSVDADEYHIWTFTVLPSNFNYVAGVTAIDLAGNTNTSETNVTTAPASPVLSFTERNYCYISLVWNPVDGAVSYDLYNLEGTIHYLIVNTSNTTYNVTGLTSGSEYNFYVKAINSDGLASDKSNTLVSSTLSIQSPIITGSSPVCTSGKSFSVTNKPAGCSLLWEAGPGLTVYSTNENSATIKATGNYTGSWVKAIYDSGCGTNESIFTVDAGSPTPGQITILWDVPPRRFTAYIEPIPSATSYKWYLDGVLKFDSPEYDVFFTRQIWNCEHIYDVDVKAINVCGESGISHTEVMEDPCDFTFKVFPNPTSNEITISQNNLNTKSSALENIKEPISIESVKIIDNFGNIYFEKIYTVSDNYKVNIDLTKLKKGSYFVIINYNSPNEEVYPILKN